MENNISEKENFTVTFFSNFLLHHQTPFCDAMYDILGDNFKFVATTPVPADRLEMGYKDLSGVKPYSVNAYLGDKEKEYAKELGEKSDVVILGDAPIEYIEKRLLKNKLTFRYSERFFKDGRWRILDPRVLRAHYNQSYKFRNKNYRILCAGAYVKGDCDFLSCFKNKKYRFGYFPERPYISSPEETIKDKEKFSILWVGRFVKLKHPELALYVAKRLKKDGIDFTLTFEGDGDLKPKIEKAVSRAGLCENVKFTGFASPDEVLEKMKKSDLFLFTSDKKEGWGAVLSESMSCCCAVIANEKTGSAPYLIKDGENGFMYNGRPRELYKKVKLILKDQSLKNKIQLNAFRTINEEWNADVSAKRLIRLIKEINSGKDSPFSDGPLSKDD